MGSGFLMRYIEKGGGSVPQDETKARNQGFVQFCKGFQGKGYWSEIRSPLRGINSEKLFNLVGVEKLWLLTFSYQGLLGTKYERMNGGKIYSKVRTSTYKVVKLWCLTIRWSVNWNKFMKQKFWFIAEQNYTRMKVFHALWNCLNCYKLIVISRNIIMFYAIHQDLKEKNLKICLLNNKKKIQKMNILLSWTLITFDFFQTHIGQILITFFVI